MAIDRAAFAADCVAQGLNLKVNSHYLIAVAQLRSGISDATVGDRVGPYGITKAQWAAFNSLPNVGFTLLPNEINDWRSQTSFAGAMAAQAFQRLKLKLQRNPSARELYEEQFPDDTQGMPGRLQTAVNDTAQLFLDAIDVAVQPGQSAPSQLGNVGTPSSG